MGSFLIIGAAVSASRCCYNYADTSWVVIRSASARGVAFSNGYVTAGTYRVEPTAHKSKMCAWQLREWLRYIGTTAAYVKMR